MLAKGAAYALPLAKQHNAAITLLYVVPSLSYFAGEYAIMDCASMETTMRKKGKEDLAALATDEVRGKVPAETMVRTGVPTTEILKAAKSLPADLIVISTHGRTGLQHVLLGSVAEHIVRHAPCPILVLREREHEFVSR